MKKTVIIGALALVTVGGAFAFAQQRGPDGMGRPAFEMSREDRQAMLDGRIAGAKAMLKLNAEQEKLWAPVETALREQATRRVEQREKMREAMQQRHAQTPPGSPRPPEADPIKMMRDGATMMQERAAAITKIADVSAPLYASLDDSQKRRFTMILRQGQHGGGEMGHRGWHRGGPDQGNGGRL